jgi:hypothetical protein
MINYFLSDTLLLTAFILTMGGSAFMVTMVFLSAYWLIRGKNKNHLSKILVSLIFLPMASVIGFSIPYYWNLSNLVNRYMQTETLLVIYGVAVVNVMIALTVAQFAKSDSKESVSVAGSK